MRWPVQSPSALERLAQLVHVRAIRSEVDGPLAVGDGRLDPELLSPIRHRGEQAQRDLALLRTRHVLVAARTRLVSSLRGLINASGSRLPKQATPSIGHRTRERVPKALRKTLSPMLLTIEFLNDEITTYDRKVDRLATERYPETAVLTQVTGVGNLTVLAYVLTLEDPCHFASGLLHGRSWKCPAPG